MKEATKNNMGSYEKGTISKDHRKSLLPNLEVIETVKAATTLKYV